MIFMDCRIIQTTNFMAKKDWKVYNEHLVREVFLIFDLNSVNKEPERRKKVGRPIEHSKELMTQFEIIMYYNG